MKRSILFLALAALVALSACERRPLLILSNSAVLDLTIHDTLPVVGKVFQGEHYEMRIYGHSDGVYRSSAFWEPTKDTVNIPAGNFDMVFSYFDSQVVHMDEGENIRTFHAYTRNASTTTKALFDTISNEVATRGPKVVKTQGLIGRQYLNCDVAWEPDWFFAGRSIDVDVPYRSEDDELFVLKADAYSEVRPVIVNVLGITGKENVSSLTAFFTGLTRGVYLSTGSPDGDAVAITFQIPVGEDGKASSTYFRTFGFLPDEQNILLVLITDTAGGNYLFGFNVTDQCEAALNDPERVVEVSVSLDFEVPAPEVAGGGLDPTVDDWNVIYHTINL